MYHSDPHAAARATAAQVHAARSNPPEVYIPGRTPSQQAAHDEAGGQFLDGLSSIIWGLWAAGPIFLAGKAGLNWNELTGDKGAAVERSAQALVRWKWFQAGAVWTIVFLTGGWLSLPTLMTTMNITMWWCIFFWLVLYVRMAEFSLLRRGPIQWIMTPATRIFDGVHTWALVVAALLPLPAALMLAVIPSAPSV